MMKGNLLIGHRYADIYIHLKDQQIPLAILKAQITLMGRRL